MRLIPGFIPWPEPRGRTGDPFTLFCLAPHGVFPAPSVTLGAVSSYLAFSPLPVRSGEREGGIFSVTLSVAPPLRRSSPAFTGHVAVRCPDFPLPPCGGSDRLRPVPRNQSYAREGPRATKRCGATPQRRARPGPRGSIVSAVRPCADKGGPSRQWRVRPRSTPRA